ncbi:MAG: hypothetical protein DRJ03_10400, partial [Chloroflexi bacterium]
MIARSQHVIFPATDDGPLLEGVLRAPDGSGPFPTAIVCHPHPLMGGDMNNTVVVTVCRALAERGWITLCFNFRGAGDSSGSFDEGRGEMKDVAGAVDFLCARPDVDADRLAVVGYSFGAEVGLHHAARDSRVSLLVGIALIQKCYADSFLDADPRPKLFVAGDRDSWAPAGALREYVARLRQPK